VASVKKREETPVKPGHIDNSRAVEERRKSPDHFFEVIRHIGFCLRAGSTNRLCVRFLGRIGEFNHDRFFFEEFDPGSERTLAAGFRHASRARKAQAEYSGVRVSNG
jgi:hypothetical protein